VIGKGHYCLAPVVVNLSGYFLCGFDLHRPYYVEIKCQLDATDVNRFVIFHMCGEEKVNVAHFLSFSVFLAGGGFVVLCSISRFSLCSMVIGKLLAVAI
jgi:hypothetical protein